MSNYEVAKLLSTIRLDLDRHPREWTRFDGTPLTDHEVSLVLNATADDLRAAAVLRHLEVEVLEARARAAQELKALVGPLFDAHPEVTSIGGLYPHMTDEQRAKLTELARLAKGGEV